MASIFRNKNWGYGVETIINHNRQRFYGFPTTKEAEIAKEKIEELQDAPRLGGISRETRLWLKNMWRIRRSFYDKLVELGLAEPIVECGTLGELIEHYVTFPINGRVPKARTSRNRRVAVNMLVRFLANQRPGNYKADEREIQKVLDKQADFVTPLLANQIYTFMQSTYAVGTWGRRIKHMKCLFDDGIRLGWFEKNPFQDFKGNSSANRSRDFYISPELAYQVLNACPDARMKLIFSFGRWGGLRIPSEIAYMTWADIQADWITIKIPKKTSHSQQERGEFTTRLIPCFPEIRRAVDEYRRELVQVLEREPAKTEKVFPELNQSETCATLLRKELTGILKRSGLPVWPKIFQNLRSTRDSELQRMRVPIATVCAWLGHTQQISEKNYFQVPESDYVAASRWESPRKSDYTGEIFESPDISGLKNRDALTSHTGEYTGKN
ncbi:MAG: site-specific integrase [Thermoguttaceae bacterium]|nr:site-specific integrase [Thermoguttaceae bacterium]